MVDGFDGFNKQLGSSLSGGKRKKSNGHKADCGCPICKNMMKKSKKGGVLLVGGKKCSVNAEIDIPDGSVCPGEEGPENKPEKPDGEPGVFGDTDEEESEESENPKVTPADTDESKGMDTVGGRRRRSSKRSKKGGKRRSMKRGKKTKKRGKKSRRR